jgi:predicted dehydrogenase
MPQVVPVRLGVIGAGGYMNTHMEAYREFDGVEVVAFCRRSPDALAEAQKKWDVPHGFTDYRDLLSMDGLDAVVIVTPTHTHREIALDAIAAGKHVLCEKPLAMTAADSREMLGAAEVAGIVHATNFNQRGRTPVGRMQRYIAEGYVGRPYHLNIWWGMTQNLEARPGVVSWRFRPEFGGGTVYELVHVLDMALFLFGDVKRICALLSTSESHRAFADVPEGMDVTVPDSSAYLIEFDSGATGVIHVSFVTRGLSPDCPGPHVTAARVEVSGDNGRIETVGLEDLRGVSGGFGVLEMLNPGSPYPLPYEQFIGAIRGGPPVRSTFEAGVKAAELVDAVYVSANESRWVEP